MKKLALVGILAALLSNSGCAVAVGYTAYKMAETSQANTKILARSTDTNTYARYRVSMSRVNLEREKAGLRPEKIMTEAEWLTARAQ